jgi:hypothetical protein
MHVPFSVTVFTHGPSKNSISPRFDSTLAQFSTVPAAHGLTRASLGLLLYYLHKPAGWDFSFETKQRVETWEEKIERIFESERKQNPVSTTRPRSISSISSHGAALPAHEDAESGRCCSPVPGSIPRVAGGALSALLCNSSSGSFPAHFRLSAELLTGITLVLLLFLVVQQCTRRITFSFVQKKLICVLPFLANAISNPWQ